MIKRSFVNNCFIRGDFLINELRSQTKAEISDIIIESKQISVKVYFNDSMKSDTEIVVKINKKLLKVDNTLYSIALISKLRHEIIMYLTRLKLKEK